MNKKIISIMLVLILIMTNVVIAADAGVMSYAREGGSNLTTIAKNIDDEDLYISAKYNTKSNKVKWTDSDIKILDYGTSNEKSIEEKTTETTYNGNVDDWYISKKTIEGDDFLFYTIKLGAGAQKCENMVSFLYKGGITYNNKTYDVKVDVEEVNKKGADEDTFVVRLAGRDMSGEPTYTEEDDFNYSTYQLPIYPSVGMGITDKDAQIEAKVKYSIVDESGNNIDIFGVFGITDIDLNQGVVVHDFAASAENENVFMYKKTIDNIDTMMYKLVNEDDDTFIYSSTSENIYNQAGDPVADAHILIDSKSDIGLTFTFDTKSAYSSLVFQDSAIKRKVNVEYDAKGGTPTPDTEEVIPGGKVTEPTETPTKAGYTFGGWKKTADENVYDFNTAVTEDMVLEASWTPVNYNITYVLNATDATNDSRNPEKYTIEDTIDFQAPTREGYEFKGWYEDPGFQTRKDGISNETGDKTVYAKWEAIQTPSYAYKIEHYKETTNGNYELAVTDNLTEKENQTVTAVPKEYTGFKENTTHADRVPSGTVKSDGSLVLKLYYDKEEYTVKFDTKEGKPIPETQTVKYQDKATKPSNPTKDGYEFQYWYYENEQGDEVQYNFDDPVTRNIELIAKWKEITEDPETPSDSNSDSDEDNDDTVIPSSKIDPTTAGTTLPNTGKFTAIAIACIIVVAIALGIRYNKFKNMMK